MLSVPVAAASQKKLFAARQKEPGLKGGGVGGGGLGGTAGQLTLMSSRAH